MSENFDRFISKMSAKKYYHYTNLEAIKGILTTKQVWLTHHKHLNDVDEILTGLEAYNDNSLFNNAYRCFEGIVNNTHFFVASYTNMENSEYHWQEYGPICLGVSDEFLTFYECIYEKDKQQKALNNLLPLIENFSSVDKVDLHNLTKYLYQFKSQKYKNEDEVRHVTMKMESEFECVNNKPIFKQNIDINKILSITLSEASKNQESALRDFLRKHNLSDIEIKHT